MSILQILGSGFLVLVLWLVLQQYKSNISVCSPSVFLLLAAAPLCPARPATPSLLPPI